MKKPGLPAELVRWRVAGGRLHAQREPAEPPGAGEVVLAVEGCSLGAAEVHALARPGVCPGNAAVGVVVAAADGLSDLLGRRLLMPEVLPCGQCALCQRGRGPACTFATRPGMTVPGALASHVRVPARYLTPADRELAPPASLEPWWLAAPAGPAARVYHALVRAGLGPGELALFVGDTAEARLGAQIAAQKGAQALVVSPTEATADAVRARLGEGPPRVWRVLDMTGRAAVARAAVALLPELKTGSLSLVGSAAPELLLDPAALSEVPLLTTEGPHPDLLPELLALCVRGDLDLRPLTARIDPAGLPAALAALLAGQGPPCPIFCPA